MLRSIKRVAFNWRHILQLEDIVALLWVEEVANVLEGVQISSIDSAALSEQYLEL